MAMDRMSIQLGRCYRDTFGAVYRVEGYNGNEVRYAVYDLAHQAKLLNSSTRNRGPIFLQTWKVRSNALNLIVQTSSDRTIAGPVLTPAIPTVVGSDARERRPCGSSHPFLRVHNGRCPVCMPTPNRPEPSVPADRRHRHSIARSGGCSCGHNLLDDTRPGVQQ